MLQLWIFKSFWFVSHVKTSILLCHTSLFKNNCVLFYSSIIISPLIKGQHAARYQFNNPPCTPRRLSVWWMALPKPRELRVGCAEIKAMVLTTKTQKPRSVLGSGGGGKRPALTWPVHAGEVVRGFSLCEEPELSMFISHPSAAQRNLQPPTVDLTQPLFLPGFRRHCHCRHRRRSLLWI